MAAHNDLGERGETAAACYLMRKGYTLLDRNWHSGHLEIDLIADWFGEIVFVEVKTRSNETFEEAALAVTLNKQRHLVAAARAYLAEHKLTDFPYRFDIVSVIGNAEPFKLRHYRNAYTERSVAEHRTFGQEPLTY